MKKFLITTVALLVINPVVATRAQVWQECVGILHKERDGLRFGGGKGEGEGICVINKSEESKVLAACSPGQFCKVKGVIEDCKDSGKCSELTHVISVRRK
jgi:hypothetical protein